MLKYGFKINLAFMESVTATAILLIVVCIVTDPRNKIPPSIIPLIIGLGIFTCLSSYLINAGCVINPSGNLGGRIFLLFAGYGWEVFS